MDTDGYDLADGTLHAYAPIKYVFDLPQDTGRSGSSFNDPHSLIRLAGLVTLVSALFFSSTAARLC